MVTKVANKYFNNDFSTTLILKKHDEKATTKKSK